MSNGIKIFNTGGDIVIDQDFRNLEVIQSGTVAGSNSNFTVNFPTTEFALAFFEVDVGQSFAFGLTSTTQARWTVDRSTCKYKIVAPRSNGDLGSGNGIGVFDGSGRCVYSSNREYVKVIEAVNIPFQRGEYNFGHAAVPGGTLVCGAFLGIYDAFCSWISMRVFTRSTNSNIRVSGGFINSSHLMDFTTSDWGDGSAGGTNPSFPLIYGV